MITEDNLDLVSGWKQKDMIHLLKQFQQSYLIGSRKAINKIK